MRGNEIAFGVMAAVLGVAIPMNMALADADELPPLPVLAAQWWQWALSIPSSENPLLELDTTPEAGQKCTVGQRGAVWFLAGTFTGSPATRTCAVPANTPLFFPVANFINVNAPNVCGQSDQNVSAKDLRAISKASADSVNQFSVKVDGKQIQNQVQRVQSEVFEISLPKDNLFNAPCGGPDTVPSGIYSPSVDDGYYIKTSPLKPGTHSIQFQTETSGAVVQDVTYNLTVVPVLLR